MSSRARSVPSRNRSTPPADRCREMFSAPFAALLDEDWTTPKIEELLISSDRCILARPTGEVTHKLFIGAEADLIRNIHGIAEVAGLDGDELGYLLGKVAEARRID